MSIKSKLFRLWTQDGFCEPVFSDESKYPAPHIRESIHVGRPDMPWEPWRMGWFREAKDLPIPDLAGSPLPGSCSEAAAKALWPDGAKDFELLPIMVGVEPWRLLCCTRYVDRVAFESSDINWSEWQEDGQQRRVIVDVRWLNVVDSDAHGLDAFRLTIQPRVLVFYTEKFKNRCELLGLTGARFAHVGYIVDKPEDAVPPPPRPVAQAFQAPRWPKCEEASNEEVALFTQAGEAFLQARGLSASSDPSAVLAALAADIEAHRPSYGKLKPKVRKELLSGLAGAFGLLLRHKLHWNWVDLQVTSRAWDLGLASPNGSHALCLNQVMVRQLTSHEPSTIVLLFNMIAAGNLPDGQPGDHVAIG